MRSLFPNSSNAIYGFTMIELLVSLSVASIIGAVGFASYNSYASKQEFANAAQNIKTEIERAKNNAIARVKVSSITDSAASVCDNQSLNSYRFVICNSPNSSPCISFSSDYETQYQCGNQYGIYNKSGKKLPPSLSIDVASNCGKIEFFTGTGNVLLGNSQPSCDIVIKNSSGKKLKMTVDSGGNVSEP